MKSIKDKRNCIISSYITEADKKALKALAKKMDVTLSVVVQQLIQAHLLKLKNNKKQKKESKLCLGME